MEIYISLCFGLCITFGLHNEVAQASSKNCFIKKCTCKQFAISCRKQSLTEVPDTKPWNFEKANSITEFDLSYNKIDALVANNFYEFVKLRKLILKSNRIEDIDEKSFNINARGNISPLEYIDLSDNHLHFFPPAFGRTSSSVASFSNLTTLLIGGNLFGPRVDMNSFYGISSVTKLDLSRNLIRSVPDLYFKKLNKLQYLDLSSNNLEKMSAMLFPQHVQLRTLKLNHNNLERFPENLPGSLEELQASNNKLDIKTKSDITSLKKLRQLRILDLSRNKIQFLPYSAFSFLSRLEYLDLSRNKLKVLDVDIFQGSRNLKYLFLHDNGQLSNLMHFSFATLPKLRYLAVQECLLSTLRLPESMENNKENILVNLKSLWLHGNPINCDCHIASLKRFLKAHRTELDPLITMNFSEVQSSNLRSLLRKKFKRTKMQERRQTVCFGPLNRFHTLAGKVLLNVSASDLTCPDEARYVIISSFLGIFAFLGVIPVVSILIQMYLLMRRFAQTHFGCVKEKED